MKENIFKWGFALVSLISFIGLIVGLSTSFGGQSIFECLKDFKYYKGAGLVQSHIGYVIAGSFASGLFGVSTGVLSYKLFRGDVDFTTTSGMIRAGLIAASALAVSIAVFACVGDLKNDIWVAKQLLKSGTLDALTRSINGGNYDPYGTNTTSGLSYW